MSRMYSAFISSVYESLLDERDEVIKCLLDKRVFPICMEHFTVSASERFEEIKGYIDDSDFFILILGSQYGSCDEKGYSWTYREFLYAKDTGKPILAIVCDDLAKLRLQPSETWSADEKKQIQFWDEVGFARKISEKLSISQILGQFLSPDKFENAIGWDRGEGELSANALAAWQGARAAYDLRGVWYHVHLSAQDPKYIRIGWVDISQDFDPENYRKLHFKGTNHNVKSYDETNRKIIPDTTKRSTWEGRYDLAEDGKMFGIFHSKRSFNGEFDNRKVDVAVRRGIHDFEVEVHENERVEFFEGEFHDEAPSPKFGVIYMFRTEQARVEYLLENYPQALGLE